MSVHRIAAQLNAQLARESSVIKEEIKSVKLTAKKVEATMQELKKELSQLQEVARDLLPENASKPVVLKQISEVDVKINSFNGMLVLCNRQIKIKELEFQRMVQFFKAKIQEFEATGA